jgi:hypothetical protein
MTTDASTPKVAEPAAADRVFATPHKQKLEALLVNGKLPAPDKEKVQDALTRYSAWVKGMNELKSAGDELLRELVRLLTVYKRSIEIDLIYDSKDNFLYRQKGQHKVDNSILEEFLPRLADVRLVPGLKHVKKLTIGPQNAFAAFKFVGNFHTSLSEGGLFVKGKDQDYALSKQVYLKASSDAEYTGDTTYETVINVAYLAAEVKTNLDSTMFNEGMETARALKQAVAGSRYLLLCEWLDMPPIDTATTDIDEAIILRTKAKRLSANFRERLGSVEGRAAARKEFIEHYDAHPFSVDSFKRIIHHMNLVFPEQLKLDEGTVLERGYF